MTNFSNYFVRSISLGVLARIIDAAVKFFTLPILVSYLGIEKFGLLTFIFALNSFSQILNFGVNTGSVKFFSQFIQERDNFNYNNSIRVNLGFYMLVAILNSIIYIVLYLFPSIINVTGNEVDIFKKIILISFLFIIISWINNTFEQVITANHKISFLHQTSIIKSLVFLLGVIILFFFDRSIILTYVVFSIANTTPFLFNLFYVANKKLINEFIPSFNLRAYKNMFLYSIGIFLMGIFQIAAVQSKPIILKLFLNNNVALTEYRILEVFPLFLTSMGGIAIATLLPVYSRFVVVNNFNRLKKIILRATTFSSFITCLICFPLIIFSDTIIFYYVGKEFSHLSIWLEFWFFTTIFFLHNIPFATYILSTGRNKHLIFSSAISFFSSATANILLIKYYGVGSTVIAYSIYIAIQMTYYYIIIMRKEGFDNKSMSYEFLKFFLLGFVLYIFSKLISDLPIDYLFAKLLAVFVWLLIYIFLVNKLKWIPKFSKFL